MVCVDASLILASLLPEEFSLEADTLLGRWDGAGEVMVAPQMLMAEVPSVLRLAVYTNRASLDEAETALKAFQALPIRLYDIEPLVDAAWSWAGRLHTPRLYDLYYLALADALDCDLWVVEQKLLNLVNPHSSRVKWVGDIGIRS